MSIRFQQVALLGILLAVPLASPPWERLPRCARPFHPAGLGQQAQCTGSSPPGVLIPGSCWNLLWRLPLGRLPRCARPFYPAGLGQGHAGWSAGLDQLTEGVLSPWLASSWPGTVQE